MNSEVTEGVHNFVVGTSEPNEVSEQALAGISNHDRVLDEQILLQEIRNQMNERDEHLRAKDIQLQEMEARMNMLMRSSSYRLARTLCWPARSIKRLFG